MFKLVHGEVCGLTWYEVPRAAAGWAGRNLDPSVEVITVIAPLGRLPGKHVLDLLATFPERTSIVSASSAFRPFDPAVVMPGRTVMYAYHDIDDAGIDAWAKANLPIPPELDLTFGLSRLGDAVTVTAATIRKGRLVNVRRRLDAGRTMGEAFAEQLPYLLRNCPRPSGDLAEFTCSAHIAHLLGALPTSASVAIVRRWLDEWRDPPSGGVQAATVLGEFLTGTGVARLSLDMFPGTNAVKATVTLAGGHVLTDIDTGVAVTLSGEIPHTVATALKGRSLGDVIGAEWVRPIKIRMVRETQPGSRTVSMTGAVEGVALRLPDVAPPSDEEAERAIAEMTTGKGARWRSVTATALPVLRSLPRADLLEVLTLLVTQQVDLSAYGHPGWVVRGRGPEVMVEECPSMPATDVLTL